MTVASFVLLNNCSDPELTPAKLAQIAGALEVQANRDVGAYWLCNVRVRAATSDNPPVTGEIVAAVVDELPNAPDAIAYHEWAGVPDIFAARSMCATLTDGNGSLSQALSHEVCETIGDDATNLWADDGVGQSWARELCDAVEASWYPISVAGTAIAVSDFLLPAWFQPGKPGPYSYLHARGGAGPGAPFTLAPGGYSVVRAQGTGETQVLGAIQQYRLAKKRHPTSRTFRRGARV